MGLFRRPVGCRGVPIGLILTILAGGELLTGNMMTLPMARFAREIPAIAVLRNWFWVTQPAAGSPPSPTSSAICWV